MISNYSIIDKAIANHRENKHNNRKNMIQLFTIPQSDLQVIYLSLLK